MTRYERRKLKTNLYKHKNTIMYIAIFMIAGIITIAAAANRTDKIMYVDESKASSTEKEAVAMTKSSTQKVAVSETNSETVTKEETEVRTEPTTEETQTTKQQTEPVSEIKVRVTADTLKVRAQASQEADMLGMVDEDDIFDVISQNGEWIEIRYNGTSGFISSEFTEIVE